MKWRGINSLTYLTFSSVRGVFGRPLPGFRKVRSIADPRSSTRLQIAFTGKVACSDKSVAYVTNNKRLYSTFCTVEANY